MSIQRTWAKSCLIFVFAAGMTSVTYGESQLDGLFRTLKWQEFNGPVPPNTQFSALTKSSFSVSRPKFHPTSNKKWILGDQVIVRINFNQKASWKHPAVSTLSPDAQQGLLDHEQWHYNITALVARDLFIQLMSLKEVEYNTEAEAVKFYDFYERTYRATEQEIQEKYDWDTGHSQTNTFTPSSGLINPQFKKGSTQAKWERIMQQAFTTDRTPQMVAPDGASYKVELVEILKLNQLFP